MFPTQENSFLQLSHKHHHKKGKKRGFEYFKEARSTQMPYIAVPSANLASAAAKDIYQDKRMGNAMALPAGEGQFVNVPMV